WLAAPEYKTSPHPPNRKKNPTTQPPLSEAPESCNLSLSANLGFLRRAR
uniref:Uncharacterized protein n=1 Tax=Aegilops tauschii subsp. strangulata TaxID=200361 RepID=A0A453C3D8_AEGTS